MDFVDIGPECFASKDLTVISYKGDNYYKACGVIVRKAGPGTTSCVRRVNHPGVVHEDFDGNIKREDGGITTNEM